ncbi:hypothetical protein MKUB_34680 [Mycobacterium kubicae]|uniref:LPXTG cell wall anchor domain-containing protein n=1 Tax=Mycobacterium kubicae TaxID=120959 RepID=A0AAX1J894_9MYCO|nr:WGxxGxxG family protein [Mycobacterium kubicae]MCV7098278.1 hypothetical protein [Mycobacterium kubicae]OBF15569.1 hypothetical protein A5725_05180 [Mycobacterium kubicae]OBK55732.1 hypothetical protein A5657_10660 [Mycobacterium kubicae]ORV98206.1 hypothetical protein AWC13_14535 [Mycobacterium kubicae]QNI14207.1 hypothetical protein GAN18_26835 [Mycobacterium kubicae]
MRKTLAVMCATGSLLFGGAGLANATTEVSVPASTTTIVADNDANNNNHSDKTGLWGLTGLLGLLGLAGLKRRNDVRPTAGTTTTNPRGGAV